MATPAHPNELAPIDVRRAVLAVLLRAHGGPLTIAQIVERTRTDSHLDLAKIPGRTPPHRRVSDILRHQVRAGRAQVVERGIYLLFVEEFARSTQWRALHWEDARRERLRRRYLGRS
jgi:hypothetical protein